MMSSRFVEEDDDPMEFEISPHVDVFNIHHPGGIIKGPVYFQLDDSVEETIETLLEDYNIPGAVDDYSLSITDNDGKVKILKRKYPVEDFLELIKNHKKIEVSPRDREAEEGR